MPAVFSVVVAFQAVLAGATHLERAPALLSSSRGSGAHVINPELDPESHNKFFKKDYPHDTQPSAHGIMSQPGKVYPNFQHDAEYDMDYVKDENADGGEWHTQMEYDRLRTSLKRMRDEVGEAEEHERQERKELEVLRAKAAKARADAAAARAKAAEARDAHEAAKAKANQLGGKAGGADGVVDSVAEAEAAVKKEEADYADCRKQLEDVKKELAAAMAKADAHKAKADAHAAKTEKKMHEAKKDLEAAKGTEVEDYDAKVKAVAEQEASVAESLKAEEEERARAKKDYEMSKSEIADAEKELESTASRLRKHRSVADPEAAAAPADPEAAAAPKSAACSAAPWSRLIAAAAVAIASTHAALR